MQKPDFLKGRKGITFVDLFAGAGGFSEGFMQAYTDKNYYDRRGTPYAQKSKHDCHYLFLNNCLNLFLKIIFL